jgi:predicted ArsR family transcriptional regulator
LKRQRTNAVNAGHARVILLSHGGVRNREIANRLGITAQWVRRDFPRRLLLSGFGVALCNFL